MSWIATCILVSGGAVLLVATIICIGYLADVVITKVAKWLLD